MKMMLKKTGKYAAILMAIGLVAALAITPAFPQVAGNRDSNSGPAVANRRYPAGYSMSGAEQVVSEQPNLLVSTYQFIDAKILTSVPTTAYIAMFGLSQEASKLEEANRRLQDQLQALKQGLASMGIPADDVYLDFITQTRTYDYQIKDNVAREKSAGFQIKKNLSIRYRDRNLLDRIVPLAAQNGIFDLIKVDYLTDDTSAVRLRMVETAQKLIKQKEADYRKLGVQLTPVSVTAETFESFQPSDAYSSYRAYETGTADDNYRVIEKRKNSTLYFDALDPMKFDAVLSTIGIEPQVQCTYYLRMKYLIGTHTTVVPQAEVRKQ